MANNTTKEVLKSIESEGGFNNWQHWNEKELAEWVEANYHCSKYVAKNVAPYLRNGYGLDYNPNA